MIPFIIVLFITLFLISRIFSNGPEEVPLEMCKTMNIIEFAKSLDVDLYPAQELILKMFYVGTKNNENLEITDEDIKLIKSWSIKNDWLDSKIDLIKNNPDFFKELILVVGRRSRKSFTGSLIAVYEIYKLLMIPDPQKYYEIDSNIYVIATGMNQCQSSTVLGKTVRELIMKSVFIETRVSHDNQHEIRFKTDADVLDGKKRGSVVFMASSCNAAALRGHNAICIILDEFGHFRDPFDVYNSLRPCVYNFGSFGDGRIVITSSPSVLGTDNFFYEKFENAKTDDKSLVFQLPTWDTNPYISREKLNVEFEKDEKVARMEFGAEFI